MCTNTTSRCSHGVCCDCVLIRSASFSANLCTRAPRCSLRVLVLCGWLTHCTYAPHAPRRRCRMGRFAIDFSQCWKYIFGHGFTVRRKAKPYCVTVETNTSAGHVRANVQNTGNAAACTHLHLHARCVFREFACQVQGNWTSFVNMEIHSRI